MLTTHTVYLRIRLRSILHNEIAEDDSWIHAHATTGVTQLVSALFAEADHEEYEMHRDKTAVRTSYSYLAQANGVASSTGSWSTSCVRVCGYWNTAHFSTDPQQAQGRGWLLFIGWTEALRAEPRHPGEHQSHQPPHLSFDCTYCTQEESTNIFFPAIIYLCSICWSTLSQNLSARRGQIEEFGIPSLRLSSWKSSGILCAYKNVALRPTFTL